MKHAYLIFPWSVRQALLLVLLLTLPTISRAAGPSAPALTTATTAFFQQFVDKQGAVDYAALQRHPEPLQALLSSIATFEVAQATPTDAAAFYLNAYNVLVIEAVVARYPLTSVLDQPGFFSQQRFTVAGEQLTLDELEHNRLRRLCNDPRLNFALVCGATGCPRLRRQAYVGAQLSAQLDTQARAVLADPAFVRVDAASRSVQLPEIFRWYKTSFGLSGQTDLAYINSFRRHGAVPATFEVSYYAHDWALNDQHKPRAVADGPL